MQQVRQNQVTILRNAALSTASADIRNETLVGVIAPAGWDAAGLTFQGSNDGQTWGDVFTVSGELAFPQANVGAGRVLLFDTHVTPGLRFVKVRSGTSAAPVNQTSDRIITLLTRDTVE